MALTALLTLLLAARTFAQEPTVPPRELDLEIEVSGYVVKVGSGMETLTLNLGKDSGISLEQRVLILIEYQEKEEKERLCLVLPSLCFGPDSIQYNPADDDPRAPVIGPNRGRMEMKLAEWGKGKKDKGSSRTRTRIKLAEGRVEMVNPFSSVVRLTKTFTNVPLETPEALNNLLGMPVQLVTRAMDKTMAAPTETPPIAVAPPPSISPAPPTAGGPAVKTAAASPEPVLRQPRWQSPAFDYKINAMAVADFSGNGSLQTALADARTLRFYAYPPAAAPWGEHRLPGTAPQVISLEASDLNGNGKAELFVSLYNGSFKRAETVVLELDASGAWTKVAELAWIVRSHQDAQGRQVLAVQQLEDDRTHPYSGIFLLRYKDGRYGPGDSAIRHKRVDWIYGFSILGFPGSEGVVTMSSTDRMRIDFKKGHWRTEEAYGQTPVRITWADRILECHPRLPARYTEKGFDSLYLIRNIASLGGLAGAFGRFNSAEIYRKDWNGIGLQTAWKSPLSGYATELALVSPRSAPQEIAVAVVGTQGKSAVWVYDP